MSCAPVRERLGEYVVAALESGERERVAMHLAACAACRDEVVALRGLEATLAALARPPEVLGRSWRRVAGVVAAAAAVGLIAFATDAWLSRRPAARLDAGSVLVARGRRSAGEPVRRTELLVADGAARLVLADERIDLDRGAVVRVVAPNEVELHSGRVRFAALAPEATVLVATPLGVAEGIGADFDLRVEGVTMERGMLVGTAAVVTAGVVAGVVYWRSKAGDEGPIRLDAAQSAVISSEGARVAAEAPPAAAGGGAAEVAELARLRERLRKLESENTALTAKLKTAEGANAELERKLTEASGKRGVAVAEVMENFGALAKKGLGAFLAPGATSQLVSDLRALGDEGIELAMGLLKAEDADSRFLAAKLLEDLSDPRSIDALRHAALNDEEESVANMASHALALLGHPSAVRSLREIVDTSKREGAKVNALYGLVKLGDEDGLARARAYMEDPNTDRKMKAALGPGLLMLQDARVMPLADLTVKLFGDSEQVMMLAVAYYEKVATPEARVRLTEIGAGTTYSEAVRKAAQAAFAR